MKFPLKTILFVILFSDLLSAGPPKTKKEKEEMLRKNWDVIMQDQRVVDPNSAEGKVFNEEMIAILKSRYPNHDFTQRPVQFLLLDQDRDSFQKDLINAWTAEKDGVEYYAFSKGIFNKVQHLATVKFILGHEYEHRVYRREHGDHLPVEKGEEALCDIKSLETSFEQKDNHLALLEELEKVVFKKKVSSWSDYLDCHPIDTSRIRILQTKAGQVVTQKGYTAPPPDPFVGKIKDILPKANHSSVLSRL